ncbi:unnamed protein product [Paramecium pentaurelia]|uniref:Uncharacterized protein n=1 Tax=Paramecium pentaurelia TaxID=43138 RepID=A0A8S1VXL8_9CILI|nr:unnamed protein product [Paramecium pentaurelia]
MKDNSIIQNQIQIILSLKLFGFTFNSRINRFEQMKIQLDKSTMKQAQIQNIRKYLFIQSKKSENLIHSRQNDIEIIWIFIIVIRFRLRIYRLESFEPYRNCNCQNKENFEILGVNLKQLDKIIFVSDNYNFDNFAFSGRFKFIKVVSASDELFYQSTKLAQNYQGYYPISIYPFLTMSQTFSCWK